MDLLYVLLVLISIYAISQVWLYFTTLKEERYLERYFADAAKTVKLAVAASAQPNKPIFVPAPTVALNSPAASKDVSKGASTLVQAAVQASPIAGVAPSAVTKAEPVVAAAPQLAPKYCGASGGLPDYVSPDFVRGCTNMCLANQTLIPEMCECACARSQPFIMGIGL